MGGLVVFFVGGCSCCWGCGRVVCWFIGTGLVYLALPFFYTIATTAIGYAVFGLPQLFIHDAIVLKKKESSCSCHVRKHLKRSKPRYPQWKTIFTSGAMVALAVLQINVLLTADLLRAPPSLQISIWLLPAAVIAVTVVTSVIGLLTRRNIDALSPV